MRKTLCMLVILLVCSLGATAQFPEELQGVKGTFIGVVKIQGDLDVAHTPWGDVWRADPEIIYFGEMSTPAADTLMLNWQFTAHWCGEAFWNAGVALEWLTFTWSEPLGCYVNIVSATEDKIVLHTFTLEDEQAVWRSGILVREGETWGFDPTNYHKVTVISQRIHMYNHAVILQTPLDSSVMEK